MSGENKGQFPVTDGGIQGGTPDNYGKVEDVKQLMLGMNPTRVTQAGATYVSVAKMLWDSISTLQHQAGALSECWSGSDSSVQAQKALKLLHGQSSELYVKNSNLGHAFQTCGTEYVQWYQDHIPGTGLIHTGGDDDYAQQYVQRLNGRYQEIFAALPSTVEKDLPNVPDGEHSGGYTPVVPPLGGGVPGGGSPTVPSDPFGPPGGGPAIPPGSGGIPHGSGIPPSDPGGPGLPGDPILPGDPGGPFLPGGPGGVDDGSTSLAGFDPVGGGPGGFGGTTGGFGSGGLGSGSYGAGGIGSGGGFGSGAGGFGASEAGAGGIGPGGIPAGGAGGRGPSGAGTGAGGTGAGGRGALGRGMMPHGAGAEGEQERERTSWLTEDEDVWGADGDAAPPVIGG